MEHAKSRGSIDIALDFTCRVVRDPEYVALAGAVARRLDVEPTIGRDDLDEIRRNLT